MLSEPTCESANEARDRVLNVAEWLFTERGYAAVTLRDIADALGIKPASLYYHAPGGKEDLFVTVTERGLIRHRAGLEAALDAAGEDLRAQLQAAARWFLSQPAIDWHRMMTSDMPAIGEEQARRLGQVAGDAIIRPLAVRFEAARTREGLSMPPQSEMLAGAFVAIMGAMHDAHTYTPLPKEPMADQMIDILLDGIRPRPSHAPIGE